MLLSLPSPLSSLTWHGKRSQVQCVLETASLPPLWALFPLPSLPQFPRLMVLLWSSTGFSSCLCHVCRDTVQGGMREEREAFPPLVGRASEGKVWGVKPRPCPMHHPQKSAAPSSLPRNSTGVSRAPERLSPPGQLTGAQLLQKLEVLLVIAQPGQSGGVFPVLTRC